MMNERISEKINYPGKYIDIFGSKMHYIDVGRGDPIVFLHGVPMSSYVWRNVIPYLSTLGRCIAPDLIGFGWSEKPDISYSIGDHIKYLNKFIEELKLKDIIFVMHGWGSILGFNYAMANEKNCKGLAFYEAFLRPMNNNDEDFSLPLQEQIMMLEDEENTSDLVMNGILFVDTVIPQSAMQKLPKEEMEIYRQPFLKKGTGKPILQYIKELPHGNNKNNINKLIEDYSKKLTQSNLPKLLLYSVPGFITTMATVIWAKENLPNLEIIDVGEELHLAQEANPELVGESISVWLQGLEQA